MRPAEGIVAGLCRGRLGATSGQGVCARERASPTAASANTLTALPCTPPPAQYSVMNLAPRRRAPVRAVVLDRALERLPIFRLSDSAESAAISLSTGQGARWRVLPAPGDRLPGTFDQDVYVELLRRYGESGFPEDGTLVFTLHAFLRSIGRKVDGRNYELLRGSLARLERSTLEAHGGYASLVTPPATAGVHSGRDRPSRRFSILTSVVIERRRVAERAQLSLFPALASGEPGDVRATVGAVIRENLAAGRASSIVLGKYLALGSPVARRIYRLLAASTDAGADVYRVSLDRMAELLPLSQRYPSHLLRVLHPAHDQLVETGIVSNVRTERGERRWRLIYEGLHRGAEED